MAALHEHRTPYGTYRLVSAPSRTGGASGSLFSLATYGTDDGRSWCLSVVSGMPQPSQFRNLAHSHLYASRSRAALAARERFMGEALAYVRSRPPGCRSDYLDDATPGMEDYAVDAVSDVRGALARALLEGDPFRAAVVFETSTPYLRADVGLVHLMERILPAFESHLALLDHHAAAAADMEAEVKARSQFASKQIDLWRGTGAQPRA